MVPGAAQPSCSKVDAFNFVPFSQTSTRSLSTDTRSCTAVAVDALNSFRTRMSFPPPTLVVPNVHVVAAVSPQDAVAAPNGEGLLSVNPLATGSKIRFCQSDGAATDSDCCFADQPDEPKSNNAPTDSTTPVAVNVSDPVRTLTAPEEVPDSGDGGPSYGKGWNGSKLARAEPFVPELAIPLPLATSELTPGVAPMVHEAVALPSVPVTIDNAATEALLVAKCTVAP